MEDIEQKTKIENTKYDHNRESWIDTLRGIGILFVILGHCEPPFDKIIYSFHMPLFFLISGYLFKSKKNIKDYLKKIFIKYIIPYFLLCIINLLLVTIIDRDFKINYVIGILYSRGTTSWLPNCSPLWFLTCITVALFIFNLILHIKNNLIQLFLILLCIFISYLLDIFDIPKLIWNIDSALMANCYLLDIYCTYIKIR